MPRQLVAYALFVNSCRAVAHGEVQRGGAVAASGVGAAMGRCVGGCGVGRPMPRQ